MPDFSPTAPPPQNDSDMVDAMRDPTSHFYRYNNEVWTQWREYFFRIARKKGLNEDDAEDLVQEVCIRAQKALENFRFESKLITFLHGVFSNCWLDWQHKRYRKDKSLPENPKRIPEADDEMQEEQEPLSTALPVEETVFNQELVRLVIAEVQRIHTHEHFRIFCLHYIEGWPSTDIAETMNLPLGTVTSVLGRTVRHFRPGGDRYHLILPYIAQQNHDAY